MEYAFKVIVVGEMGVGKTSLIKQYVHGIYTENGKSTIGVDFALKHIKTSENERVEVQMWDIAGQERFGTMTRVYYRDAKGCFVVYNVNDPGGLDKALKWIKDLKTKTENTIPIMLLGNKCDLKNNVDAVKALELTENENLEGCILTSAKANVGIDTAVSSLVKKMIQNQTTYMLDTPDVVDLMVEEPFAEKQNKACCK